MKACVIILLILVFYICGNIGSVTLGLPNGALLAMPAIYSTGVLIARKQCLTNAKKQAAWIIAGGILLLCLHYIINPEDKIIRDITILILPALIISSLPLDDRLNIQNLEIKHIVAQFLLIFYIAECSIAILEFALHEHLFGWADPTYHKGIVTFDKTDAFRSVALMGSPLNNALIVTAMMLFYLFDPSSGMKRKMSLWILGLAAIFCFNARTAIVINILSMLLFVAKGILDNRSKRLRYIIVFITAGLAICIMYLCGMGTRLWETGYIGTDESIGTRMKLFQYLLNKDWTDFLWGSSQLHIQHNMWASIKVKIIENFWVLYIFRFGIVASAYFTFFYLKLGRELFKYYSRLEKVAIPVFFIVLASINNSMASNFTPLAVFLLCAYAYNPIGEQTEVIRQKVIAYLSKDKEENTF